MKKTKPRQKNIAYSWIMQFDFYIVANVYYKNSGLVLSGKVLRGYHFLRIACIV
jgi:hypothetical protein